jgi:hypothetical protein
MLFALFPVYPDAITSISITGLKRTRSAVAERYLHKFLGVDADEIDLNKVHAEILDTGILEPVLVEIRDGTSGKVLTAEVKEKWALFPLPLVFISSGGTSFGGFLVDTNAFGLNDKIFAGGLYNTDGWMLGGSYMHTPVSLKMPGWNIAAFFNRQEREDTDQNAHVFRRFNMDSLRISTGLIFPISNIISGSLQVSYQTITLKEHTDTLRAPDTGRQSVGTSVALTARKTSWDGYLLSEESVSAQYAYTIGIDASSFHSINLAGIYQKSLVPGFRLNLRSGIVYDPDVPVFSESSPDTAGVNILPSSFSAAHYAGGSAGFEKYLFQISAGTLSILASYQAVFSQGPILGDQFDHGVAASLSFYLSKLAIPAVGVGAAYNVAADYWQGSFSIGMSF